MLYEFKSRYTGAVCASVEIADKWGAEASGARLGAAVKAAVAAKISLAGTDLRYAKLAGADLYRANLTGAKLSEAERQRDRP